MIRKKQLLKDIQTLQIQVKRLQSYSSIDHENDKNTATAIKRLSTRLSAIKPSLRKAFLRISEDKNVDKASNSELIKNIGENL